MFTQLTEQELEDAYSVAKTIVFYPRDFDTFMFRMYFVKQENVICPKKQIMDFLNVKLRQKSEALMLAAVKQTIDKLEFNSDYYAPLWTNKKNGLRGSYFPVISRTVGGLMLFSISKEEVKNGCSLH